MLKPLTKRKSDGTTYVRRPHVVQALAALNALDEGLLLRRLTITVGTDPEHVPNECVVHLLRAVPVATDRRFRDALLKVLRNRAALAIRRAIRGAGSHPDSLREQAQSGFDLLVSRGLEPDSDLLDYLEVSFDHAIVARCKDVLEADRKRSARLVEMPSTSGDDGDEGQQVEFAAPVSELAAELGLQESEFEVFRNERIRSIIELPAGQRDAIILVLFHGLPIGSEDPEADTVSRRLGVDESTVRYRIKRGVARLNEQGPTK